MTRTLLLGRIVSALLAVLALACLARPAAADSPGEPFRLEYWAEGHCPDAKDFAREVQARAPQLRPALADEPALGFYAELSERSGAAIGRLTARAPDGCEVKREVHGTTCVDVATALALIAALAADPDHPVAVLASPPAVVTAPRRIRREPIEWRTPDVVPAISPQRWTYGVGAGLGFDSSIAPSPGYGLGVEFSAEAKSGSVWRPLFALSAIRASSSNTATRAGDASFTYLAFRGAVCPLRWPQETPLFVRPCLFAEAGLLEGSVTLAKRMQAQSKSWFAAGGILRVEALADRALSFQLDGGVTAALKRNSFDSGPGSASAFQVPSAGILGRIGLSYRFQ